MISFYTSDAGVLMYRDDTYKESMLFVIDRPATDDDKAAHPDALAAFQAPGVLTEPTTPVDPPVTDPNAPTVQ